MFVLYGMSRMVRIDPRYLNKNRKEAIVDELNRQFSNRVILDVGLCMTLWDIQSVGLGQYFPGDGGVHMPVEFRYIVFRPFQDEVIMGKIKNCTREGVHVTLDFFDDIIIPPEGLQYPSRFDEREQIWIWEYQTEDENGEASSHDLYMDKGEMIKFRIIGEQFEDANNYPSASSSSNNTASNATAGASNQPGPSSAAAGSSGETSSTAKVPYFLTASINEPGLGLLSWWD